jgi:hypothetical protein
LPEKVSPYNVGRGNPALRRRSWKLKKIQLSGQSPRERRTARENSRDLQRVPFE